MERIKGFGSNVYLVNTGWTGGGYGIGKRFDIPFTRQIIHKARSGELINTDTEHLKELNLNIPKAIDGIDQKVLNPRNAWFDHTAYDEAMRSLIEKFKTNFKNFSVTQNIRDAGPL